MLLNFNFNFYDLYKSEGIKELDNFFKKKYTEYHVLDTLSQATLLQDFIVELFNISNDFYDKKNTIIDYNSLYAFKKKFIQKEVINKKKYIPYDEITIEQKFKERFKLNEINEYIYKNIVEKLIKNPNSSEEDIVLVKQYAHYRIKKNKYNNGIIFSVPNNIDYQNILSIDRNQNHIYSLNELSNRKGFSLTDDNFQIAEAANNSNYCIFCHKRNRDSCSKGFKDKDNNYKNSLLGNKLTGCPLKEHISEMNYLYSQGEIIAALIMVMINNPMCPATGYRICNDCSLSCIYQKQTPVNIPGIESNILMEVLKMDYGFEIYSLLTRWNPVNNHYDSQYREDTNNNILVVGSGPAGFSMAHYLLNYGHYVTMFEALKVEPLNKDIIGDNFIPIKNIDDIFDDLEDREIYGFGGVMEYGITVRWNKNLLKVIRIVLERRKRFKLFDGIMFGKNVSLEDALDIGFDHIVLAIGAGSPKVF